MMNGNYSGSGKPDAIGWEVLPAIAAFGSIIIAVIGLAGYLPGLDFPGGTGNNFVPMAPSTSLCFIMLGGVILFSKLRYLTLQNIGILSLVTVLVILFGILEVAGYFTGRDLNFEDTFMPHFGELNEIPVGRMSMPTGLLFAVTGVSVLMLLIQQIQPKRDRVIEYTIGFTGILALIVSFVFFLAYLYGNPLLYGREGIIPMAVTTAIGFLLLSVSILTFRKGVFPLRFLTDSSTRSYLLRAIIPITVVSVLLGGITALLTVKIISIHPAIISASLTILVVAGTVVLTTLVARRLGTKIDSQTDAIRLSGLALQESEEKYRNLFETMAQGVVFQNADGVIISANPAAEQILGLSLDQMAGRTSVDPRWKAVDLSGIELPGDKHPAMLALKTGKVIRDFVQGVYNPSLDEYVWIIVTSIPQYRENDDKPYQVYSTFLDISRRKYAEDELRRIKEGLEIIVGERTAELHEKVQKLNKSQQAMLYMVEDLNRVTAELEGERKKLELSNKELEAFSYSVSHDLRAPLRAIDGFTRILLEDHAEILDQDGKRVCNVIRTNTRKMGQLIDDLLTFSRLSRFDMQRSEIDMKTLANSIFYELTTPEMRERILFNVDDLHAAFGDPTMIRQVWANLLSNAIKFSSQKEQAKIEISSSLKNNMLTYQISDNGVGFEMKYVDKIFGVFQRLHSAKDFEGTGVGLAIVQRVIHRHGGQIMAESGTQGGASFIFSLPVNIK